MGLDTVELILGVEEAFEIEIPDEEAEKISTVGQLYAFVVNRLAGNQPPRCASSAVFYPTRRALIELSGAERRSIRPSTRIDGLLPARGRRAVWREFGQTAEARLPELELPGWMRRLLGGSCLALFVVGLALAFSAPLSHLMLYSLIAAMGMGAARRALSPFATLIPAECVTVGGTVRAIVRQKHGLTAPKPRAWDPVEAWATLRRVIAEQLDVPLERITAEASLVDDLGAD